MDKATQAYDLLVQMAKPAKQGERELAKAKEKIEGAYDLGMQAAVVCGSWEAFKPVIDRLEDNIRKNNDNMAVIFGAPKRDKADKKGNKYKIPFSVSTVKSRVKKAFEHGVSLTDEDGNARSYTSVKDELSAIAELEREAKASEAAKELTGDDKVRHDLMATLSKVREYSETLQGAELAKLLTAIRAILPVVDVLADDDDDDDATEAQAEAA
jgi:hypothetical protein